MGMVFVSDVRRLKQELMGLHKTYSIVQQNRLNEYCSTLRKAKELGVKVKEVPKEVLSELKNSSVDFLDLTEREAREYLEKQNLTKLKILKKVIHDKVVENTNYQVVKNATSEMKYILKSRAKKPSVYGVDPNYCRQYSAGRPQHTHPSKNGLK